MFIIWYFLYSLIFIYGKWNCFQEFLWETTEYIWKANVLMILCKVRGTTSDIEWNSNENKLWFICNFAGSLKELSSDQED